MYECAGSGYDCILATKYALKAKNKVQNAK